MMAAGRLAIRDDRNPRADVGLRDAIAELLLSYAPAWLRLGLEVLYGQLIDLDPADEMCVQQSPSP